MTQVGFFTDEDVYGAVAVALRNSGCDAVSTPEAGRLGGSDESQLQWASEKGRALVTFNVAHFANLHSEWMEKGQQHAGMQHAGIIVSAQRPIGELLRRLLHLAGSLD